MTHDFLNDLQVGFVLAEASAERVPQDMAAKLWQKNRVTIFFLRLGFFFLIIVCTNRADSAVDGICWMPCRSKERRSTRSGLPAASR